MTLTRSHSNTVVTVFKRDHHALTFTSPSLISSRPVTFAFTDGKTGEDDTLTSSEHKAPIGKGTVKISGGGSLYASKGALYAFKGYHAPKDPLVYVAAYVELLRVQTADATKQEKIDKVVDKVGKQAGKEIGKHFVNALAAGF